MSDTERNEFLSQIDNDVAEKYIKNVKYLELIEKLKEKSNMGQ